MGDSENTVIKTRDLRRVATARPVLGSYFPTDDRALINLMRAEPGATDPMLEKRAAKLHRLNSKENA